MNTGAKFHSETSSGESYKKVKDGSYENSACPRNTRNLTSRTYGFVTEDFTSEENRLPRTQTAPAQSSGPLTGDALQCFTTINKAFYTPKKIESFQRKSRHVGARDAVLESRIKRAPTAIPWASTQKLDYTPKYVKFVKAEY